MKESKIFIALLLLFAVFFTAPFSYGINSSKTTIKGDVDAMELRSIVVEGWENEPWDATALPAPPQVMLDKTKLVEGKPRNLEFDKEDQKSMGLRFQFIYPGYNTITLTPPKDKVVKRYTGQLDENNQPKYVEVPGLELPGQVKALSMWVLGRGNAYDMDFWIEDWTGDTHVLKVGSLDFIGWRPITVDIPSSIPQSIEAYPQTKSLVLKKIVLKTTPKTSTEEVVFFFDSLKVLTDLYDFYFDGASIDFDEKDRLKKERAREYKDQLGKGNAHPTE